ncbi:hypothetical protein BC831DRAFT_465630 [Entophlyctis helioformis]|nr:hypothetical protein BC831DRAFT_465630 [Entophlyctis helioformis]
MPAWTPLLMRSCRPLSATLAAWTAAGASPALPTGTLSHYAQQLHMHTSLRQARMASTASLPTTTTSPAHPLHRLKAAASAPALAPASIPTSASSPLSRWIRMQRTALTGLFKAASPAPSPSAPASGLAAQLRALSSYRMRRDSLRYVERQGYGRRFWDNIDPNHVVYGLIGINVAVFLVWAYAQGMNRSKGDRSYLTWMYDNFTTSYDGVINKGRYWTMLTSSFSHQEIFHLGLNMFVLHSFAGSVIEAIGVRHFLVLYILAGLASSAASLYAQSFRYKEYERQVQAIKQRYSDLWAYSLPPAIPPFTSTHSLGASGSLSGMTLTFAAMFPTSTILVLFVPMPAWVAVGGFVAYDLYRSMTGTSGRIDTAGHLGGAAMGLAYWYLRIRRRVF